MYTEEAGHQRFSCFKIQKIGKQTYPNVCESLTAKQRFRGITFFFGLSNKHNIYTEI
jgi:hypothetical protein